jgi:hypothetical protein
LELKYGNDICGYWILKYSRNIVEIWPTADIRLILVDTCRSVAGVAGLEWGDIWWGNIVDIWPTADI